MEPQRSATLRRDQALPPPPTHLRRTQSLSIAPPPPPLPRRLGPNPSAYYIENGCPRVPRWANWTSPYPGGEA